jgi:FkbH-like protein
VRRFVQAKIGLSRKVLALDLDNTLWGGVLGEVGAAGVTLGGLYPGKSYKELQRTALRLRDQGIILVLASKNDADHVDAALREHPEVVLRPDMFSGTAVNWQPKAANLRQLAEQLDLGISSFVFLDDSPFERGHVAEESPEVTVLSSEGDPAYLVRTVTAGGWFDTLDLTDTDRKRPALYQTRMARGEFAGSFGSSEEYLAALDITVSIATATEFDVPRIAQLAARTNQFNLTGLRPDEAATAAMSVDPGHLVAAFSVSDRFGDEGIVGAAWVQRGERVWRVLNLVLSCRVLGRGVELAVVEWLAARASAEGATELEGRFVPSPKNAVSASFWTKAGFTETAEGIYRLDISETQYRAPEWIRLLERSAV